MNSAAILLFTTKGMTLIEPWLQKESFGKGKHPGRSTFFESRGSGRDLSEHRKRSSLRSLWRAGNASRWPERDRTQAPEIRGDE